MITRQVSLLSHSPGSITVASPTLSPLSLVIQVCQGCVHCVSCDMLFYSMWLLNAVLFLCIDFFGLRKMEIKAVTEIVWQTVSCGVVSNEIKFPSSLALFVLAKKMNKIV